MLLSFIRTLKYPELLELNTERPLHLQIITTVVLAYRRFVVAMLDQAFGLDVFYPETQYQITQI